MKLRLLDQKEEVPNVRTFIFEAEEPLTWQPGQYMHYIFPHDNPDSRGTERWFTISSAPYEGHVQITTRFAGSDSSSFKKALLNLKSGDEIEADGPKGKFVLQEGDHHHVLIAGGIGITPYHSMLKQLAHDNKLSHATLLYANNDENFVFDDELESIAAQDSTFHESKFVGRRITDEDLKAYAAEDNSIFYLSGPEPMVENYEQVLAGLDVPAERVKTDYFPGY
ncbi:MAG TPA: FAD-dependent oxidoreductase [Candidatus Saccharimonadales bacterium]|nr:FAD-dependent oxidoreductase [Candidatus Saccharimonadales bacterium]